MIFERGNATQSFWGFYISVSLALVACVGAQRGPVRVAAFCSIAFIGFACANLEGMTKAASQRQFLYDQLVDLAERVKAGAKIQTASDVAVSADAMVQKLREVAQPPPVNQMRWFHIVRDVAILAAIWILTLFPRRDAD